MPIISTETMKTIDERGRCDTRCVVMRWSNCVSLSSIVFIISALIISIFYCLNYISLLLRLLITYLVIDFVITM